MMRLRRKICKAPFSHDPGTAGLPDYPVTPDVVGEIWDSISAAVDSQKLSINEDEAAKRYQQAEADVGA